MLRQLLIVAALAGLLAATAATSSRGGARQVSVTTSLLMPGVTYTRQVDFTPRGPVVLDVVTAPRPDGSLYTLAPALSNDAVVGTERLTDLEKRLSASATVVGVNGDAFASSGVPAGTLMRGGVLETMPAGGRSSLGIGADGTLSVARLAYKGTWQGSGERRDLDLDADPAKGHSTLYTSSWGQTTPAESGSVVEDVFASFPQTRPNQPLTGTVAQVTSAGATPIPSGGAVLVARGAAAPLLTAEAPAGQRVEVRLTLTPDWSGLAGAIGGGPLLVSGGKPVFNAREAIDPVNLNSRNARSAVGQLADGRIVLVTVEAGSLSYSIGMTNYELGIALARLGAVTAIGLGTGGAAGMAFDGTLLTRPSGAAEQPLADALVLSYTGVYAAPPAADVLSPNGDGVNDVQSLAYKLVRPSHVTATLAGPGPTTRTLVAEDEQPGVHTLQWNGTNADGSPAAEGSWRFTVTATDDTGRTTSAERDFTLDDTLGFLSVGPANGTGVAAATFRLARAASVVVTVERPNGIVVATLLRRTLEPGTQAVVWRGRDVSGRRAPNGDYQVRVAASTATGRSSLTAPFSLPLRRP